MKKNTVVGITFDATMEIKDVATSVQNIGKHFETLRKQMPQGLSKRFKSDLEELEAEMKSFKDISSDLETLGDISALEDSSKKIAKLYKKIKEEGSEIADLDLDSLMPKEILEKLASASKLTKAYKKDMSDLSDETEDYKKKIQDLINLKREHQDLARKKTAIGKTAVSDEDLVTAEQRKIKLGRDVDNAKLKSSGVDLSGKEFQTLLKQQREAANAYTDLQDKAKQYKKALSEVENELENNEKAQKKYQEVSEEFGTTLKALEKSLSNLGEDLKIEKFNKFKEELEEITGLDLSELKQDLSNLEEMLGSLPAEQMEKIGLAVTGLTKGIKGLEAPLDAAKEGVEGVTEEGKKIATVSEEVDRLKNQVIDFFSIGNAIQLFKRAISSAFETVKELDKTMTETAVVTDFTVGDMWKQLPLYSKNARDLGVSINAAYEATTLYYQQGLKTEEAMGVSNETLKMARIANIEAKDATDLMTAALRGFNMEVNAMNAQKVNDVFSKLAAITAADTEEIGIAMSKTASIAESANMEFNTTAALLTQIIETTREAPETAGTAMKTIIARFTEVKKLMTAGQLTGADEEGEVIDVNKIDTALKTVGLSLKGFMQGTEGIDDIFLKLAEKWDGLDISTQRYIATMAAGSRQQSRFLAMMGDYGRTMELVNAANTSAGASQEQFTKTLEAMDAKLNKLKGAWDTFAMGLANNEIIKGVVDVLTGLLDIINKTINALSFDNGLIKSFLSLGAAMLGLKVGSSIFNSLFDAIKESKGKDIFKTLIANLRKAKAEAAVAGAATNKFSLSLVTTKLSAMGATIATKVFGKAAVSTAAQIGIALGAIGLIIIAVGLLVFGLTKLEQKMREKTPAGKLEAAKKNAEAAAEAAQEAADAYDNLNNSLTSLEDKYVDINKLTEGTREWTRSMQELNSEVLDLVNEYPKLARFVQNKGGVLTLDIASKGVQDVIDGYEKEKKKTSIAETATSGIEKRAAADLTQGGLLENIHSYTFNKYDDDQVKAAAEKIAKGEIIGKGIDSYFAKAGMGAVNEDVLALFRQYGENQLQQDLENKDHFANLLLQLESLDFTSQLEAASIDLDKVKDENTDGAKVLKEILLNSGINDKIINDNGGWEAFITQLNATQKEAERIAAIRKKKALKNLPKSFKELEKLASQDIGVIENLGSQISVMGETAGEDYLKSFNEVLRGAKDPEALAAYLSTIDPTNMNEITAAMEYMRTQGVDSSQIENFWNKITDGAGTYIDSLETILSLIDKWNKEQLNVEGIGSRLKEGKADTADMLELAKAGVDLTDFKMTPEGWAGTEEAIKKATGALQDYYDLDQKRILEQQKEQAAKNAENRFDGIYKSEDSFKVVADSDLGVKTAEGKQLTTVDEITGKLVAGQVDMGVSQSVINALAGAGITVADKSAEETADEFLSRLQEAYNSYISLLNNKEDIEIITAKYEEMKKMKLSSAENISNGEEPEIILGSLEREIDEEGFNTDEVKAYAKELTKVNKELDEVSALQSAFASAKSQKGLKEIVDSYDDWNSILDETTGLLKDTTLEGVSTFNKFKASVNEMLNTSIDLSEEFWNNSENIKLIRDAANGSVEALSQLRQAATDDFLIQIQAEFKSKEAAAEIEEFRIWLAGYKLPDLEAGAVLNDTYFIKALNNMIAQTRLTTDQVQALVTQMGFTAKIDLVQKYVPGYTIETSSARDTKGEGFYDANRIRTIKKTIPGYTYSIPQVSIMTKNASSYRTPSGGGGGGGGGSKGGSSGGSRRGGGGSSSKPKKDTWENPYDDLYNLSEKVNKTIRDRNSLEREYDMILEDRTSSINELLANSLKQLANLRKEKALQGDILKTYQKRLKSAASQEYLGTKTVGDEEEQFWTTFQREATRLGLGSLSSYASVNSETAEITIDYSKIEAIENNTTKGEAQGALLTAFIGFLEETANSFVETKETLFDISDQIDEIEKRGKEEYVEFEQSVYDAIVQREQAIIDEYQSLSEVISNSNSEILDSLQESISLERQIRDNTDTEENISDMESRLAYLRRDTSGANDAEIRQLEKDLSDARETYSDTLVDQELQRLSDVNEKAAEQRERQIELMQSQLDYAASNGAFWEEVSRLLGSSINADGTLKANSELVNLLKVTDEFKALSYFGGKVWIDDLITAWLVALEGKANLEEEYKTTPVTTTPTTTTPTTTTPTTTKPTTTTPTTSAPVQEVYTVKSGDTLSGIASAYNKKGFNTTYQKIGKDNALANLNRIYAGQKLTIKKYKEGGLVDYTGPAWVDGTPGKPEAMLRAVDTQNFIELKEILADILKNPSKGSSKPSGDNYFDVDITVDSIANDYDVEKMASKVKEIINTDARYRNVNSINFLR